MEMSCSILVFRFGFHVIEFIGLSEMNYINVDLVALVACKKIVTMRSCGR